MSELPAIELRRLTRCFGDLRAVDSLDLTVPSGETLGLLGSNGAGKSTTLKMLTTLLPPSSGEAKVAGFDVRTQPRQVRARIGYVPQLLSADAALTGVENLDLLARLHGLKRAERKARVTEALDFMGLGAFATELVKKYSGGMIRRLEIAQSMLHRPPVLFLDEPTVGLDPVARRTVWEKLSELKQRLGTTVLLTTHDMEEAETLCDRVAILHGGKLAVLGPPSVLRAALGPHATMDDVFAHHTGGTIDEGGTYRDAARTRRTASRLG